MDCWRDMTPCIILSYIFCVMNVQKLPIRWGNKLWSLLTSVHNPKLSRAKNLICKDLVQLTHVWYPFLWLIRYVSLWNNHVHNLVRSIWEICNNGRTRITCSHFTKMDYMQTVSIVQAISWIKNSYSLHSLIRTLKVHHSVHKCPYGLQIVSAIATGNFLRYFTK